MNLVTPKMGLAWGQLKRKNSNLMRFSVQAGRRTNRVTFWNRRQRLPWLLCVAYLWTKQRQPVPETVSCGYYAPRRSQMSVPRQLNLIWG